jgi:hypothetical protein
MLATECQTRSNTGLEPSPLGLANFRPVKCEFLPIVESLDGRCCSNLLEQSEPTLLLHRHVQVQIEFGLPFPIGKVAAQELSDQQAVIIADGLEDGGRAAIAVNRAGKVDQVQVPAPQIRLASRPKQPLASWPRSP